MERLLQVIHRAETEEVSADTIFQATARDLAGETGANRISIWHFEGGGKAMVCDCFFDVGADSFSSGQVLRAADHPTYFKTIQTDNLVVAPDARSHPVTKELTEPYFREHDIHSLLDFILHDNFEPSGVICCENAGARREWRDADISYLRQVATLISFYFKAAGA